MDDGTLKVLLGLIGFLQVVIMFLSASFRQDLKAVDTIANQNRERIGVLEAERRHIAEKLGEIGAELRERRGLDRQMTAALVSLTEVLVKQLGGKEGR